MKNYFFIIILSVLFADINFPQAVDIPFTATDGTDTYTLNVGLDLTATNCIDPQLGEVGIPPIPPAGIFLICFDLSPFGCPGILTFKDYRSPGDPPAFPFTGEIQHSLRWQLSSAGLPVDITYNIPPGAIMFITDEFGGIILNLGPFSGQGVTTIPASCPLNSAILKMYYNNIGGTPTQGPVFYLLPDQLTFGEVAFGDSITLPVWVSNGGYIDSLYINDVISSNPSFTFEPNTFPLILAPGQTQNFEVTYTGITGGTHTDSLLFLHNAPDSPGKLNLYASTFEPNSECEAQMFWEIVVSDGVNPFARHLVFGLDSTATDSIDPQLGEIGPLPPFPPPGVFEAQFFLPEDNYLGTLSSYCDFRYADVPYTGQKEWRIAFQPGAGNTITISWGFTSNISGLLQDVINGTFINVPMIDSGSYTVQNPMTFNRLRMLIDFDITTPVEFSSFISEVEGEKVILNWETASEKNNKGFEIERKISSKWEKIGYVPGSGTTTEPKSYSFTDNNVTSGIYKYRLKQIDFDGTFNYSKEIEVEVNLVPGKYTLEQNYPNPFNPTTKIKYTIPEVTSNNKLSKVTLKIYDVLGREIAALVNEEKLPGIYEVKFDASSVASGIYFYKMQAGAFVQTKKMILVK
jgi:hypothetical protein